MQLRRLLRTHLGPYKRLLTLVLVLQAIQTAAALTLPTLNADIIDNGVLQGDNGYIWRTGAVMLGFSFVQIVFVIAAVISLLNGCGASSLQRQTTAARITRAALDVTDPEPLPEGHPLLDRINVIVTPHIASASSAGRRRLYEHSIDNASC